jgi:hypothetical protein
MMKIMKGEATYKDYWVLFIKEEYFEGKFKERPRLMQREEGEPPDYWEYKHQHSCGAGIQPWNVNHKVYEDYQLMWDRYYEKIQKEEIKRSLYKMFKIDGEENS